MMEDERQNKVPAPRKMLKFGTNCDLSDKKKLVICNYVNNYVNYKAVKRGVVIF